MPNPYNWGFEVSSSSMQDTLLTRVLEALGLEGAAVDRGLGVLYRAGLTRPGKSRIATAKLSLVESAIHEAIVRTCHKQACREKAERDGRTMISVAAKHCDSCGGEDNRTAVVGMLKAMGGSGQTKLLVVGGAPSSRQELQALCSEPCELRFLTEEQNPGRKTSDKHVAWADVVVIWASTPIPHKMTQAIRGPHVITCGQRGIGALAREVTRYLSG